MRLAQQAKILWAQTLIPVGVILASPLVPSSSAQSNQPPSVNVGPDQAITLTDRAFLLGLVSDDSLPVFPAAMTTTWSQISGPGTVTFANQNEEITSAAFSATGIYILRLTVSDGELSSSDDLSITVNAAHPNTIRIPQDHPTIQAGIDAAQIGDLVLVSPGTYVENLYVPQAITLASTFYTTGDDSLIDQTIISSPDLATDTIVISSSAGPETKIVGFTIRNGNDGIKVRGNVSVLNNHIIDQDTDALDFSSGAAGLVRNNVIENNGDDAVDIDDGSVLIESNLMQANGEGVEIRAKNHSAPRLTIIIRNNTITGSIKTGLQIIDTDTIADTSALIVIDRNLVSSNSQSGLSLMDNGVTSDDFRAASLRERIHLFNNTFAGNQYGAHGGDNLVALNNLFVGTTQIAVKNIDGSSTLAYNLFWNNGTDNQGSNVDLGTTLFADPLLGPDSHLQAGSPAVDAGTAQYVLPSGEIVLDLPPSTYSGTAPDLGAFESDWGNNPPTANDDSATTSQNTPITIDVAANDTDLDNNLDPATASLVTPPSNGGAVNHGDGFFTYTPDSGFVGGDSFVYRICDTDAMCATATVSITVTPPNGPPVAGDDSTNTNEDTPVIIDAGANDSDPDGNLDPTSFAVITPPTNGSVANDGNGFFTYIPDPNFNENDDFVYEVCDTLGLCDIAIVSIALIAVEDPPLASDDSGNTISNIAVTIDAGVNDMDPDGNLDFTSFSVVTAPTNGSLVNDGNGIFTFTPNPGFIGSDSFVYQVCDLASLCDSATVTITVNAPGPTTIEVRVSASSDDAEEGASGNMSLSSSDLEFVTDGTDVQTVGMRFNGVLIPQGTTILAAYIQFRVDETSSEVTSLTIRGEDADDAATFTNTPNDVTSRPRTLASASWSPPPWTTVGDEGVDQQTTDLAPVIQEIVNRAGWSSGNSLIILIDGTGKRTAESFNGLPSGAPLLHVDYSTIANQPPVVEIVTPLSQSTFQEGSTISFSGTASDTEDGDLTTSLNWVSDLDGAIGTGGAFSRSDLSVGVHTITASATDSDGLTGSDQITVTMNAAANTPPTATITAPADGSSFTQGATVSFGGSASDTEDGDLTASLNWVSDLDGTIGTGGSFSTSTLSVGMHTITATAADSGGLTDSDQITVTIEPGSTGVVDVRINASSDDAEEQAKGNVSLTSSDLELVFDRGGDQIVGMRFNGLPIPPGATIVDAWIQFQVDEANSVATALTIQAEDVDDAATFEKISGNISTRSRTTEAVPWSPVAWTTVGAAGADQRTPNLASVIQAVVDRAGWASGNSLVILVSGTGERTAETFDGNAAAAPLLHLEWSAAP